MTPAARREVAAVMAVAVVAAILLFVAGGAHWAHGTGRRPAGGSFVTVSASVRGRSVAGVVEAVALVALAAAVAVPATRGRGRVVAGVLVALGGLAGVAGAVAARSSARDRVVGQLPAGSAVTTDAWWVLAVVGSALLLAVGVVLAVRGRSWSALSSRYEPPSKQVAAGDAGTWDALDRGEDPTA